MDVSNWIDHWAGFTPDKPAIRFEGRDITYRALRDRVRGLAAVLAGGLGVGRGDRVAFLGYNSPVYLALIFACARIGAAMVPLNWRLAPPEHVHSLSDSGCRLAFVEPEFAETAAAVAEALGECRFLGVDELDAEVGRAGGDARDERADLDDPLLIVYTSGTTGRPKGAVLSQRACIFNAVNAVAMHDMTAADVVLTSLPMFHVGGLNIQTTPALHAGATVVLQRRFDPDATVAALARERPSLTVLVPAQMQALIDHPGWASLDFSPLRCIDTGSTTVPRPLLDAYLARGVPVIQVFGATETAPIAVHQRIAEAWLTAGSTGRPALHCRARVVGGDGEVLAPGAKGEIVVCGPNLMTGYWQDPGATAEALRDGWFHTGDVGHTDAGGNFYVDDRLKDVIISGSENVYPAEVERVLEECPEVAEAAVVARPDSRWGEVPVACVVPRRGASIGRADVLALCDGRLARYKRPRDVLFMDALPRNVMGKVLRYVLRESVRS